MLKSFRYMRVLTRHFGKKKHQKPKQEVDTHTQSPATTSIKSVPNNMVFP